MPLGYPAPYGTSPVFQRGGLAVLQRQIEANLIDLASLYQLVETRTTGGVSTVEPLILAEDVPCRVMPAPETREYIGDKPAPTTEYVVQFGLHEDLTNVQRIVAAVPHPLDPTEFITRTLDVIAWRPLQGLSVVQQARCREVA